MNDSIVLAAEPSPLAALLVDTIPNPPDAVRTLLDILHSRARCALGIKPKKRTASRS